MCTACACCNQSNDLLAAPCLQIMYSEGDKPDSLSEQLVRLGLGKVSLGVAVPAHALHRLCPYILLHTTVLQVGKPPAQAVKLCLRPPRQRAS